MSKKRDIILVKCTDCSNAELHRFGKNPTICCCHAKREREVAEQTRVCTDYNKGKPIKFVQH